MNHLTDEQINRYIDNELDLNDIGLVSDHIKTCGECLSKLKAQKLVDQQLRRIEVFHLPDNFTSGIMKKLARPVAHFKPKKSYFLRFIYSIFIVAVMAVVSVSVYMVSNSVASMQAPSWFEQPSKLVSSAFSKYTEVFSGSTVSIIGSVFTMILLVSAYFIYDSHKHFKNRINKLS